MAESKTALEIFVLTDQVVEREMTVDEVKEQDLIQKDIKANQDKSVAKAEARTSALAKLAALGLTEEEIAAL